MADFAEVMKNVMARRVGPDSLNNVLIASGPFTPQLTFDTPGDLSVVYTEQIGSFKRFGSLMFYYIGITATPTWTTGSGNIRITGLPVMNSVDEEPPATAEISSAGFTLPGTRTMYHGNVADNATYLNLVASGSGASQFLAAADFTSGSEIVIRINGQYFVGESQAVNVSVAINGVETTSELGTITVSTAPPDPILGVNFASSTIGSGSFSSDARYYRDASYELVQASANVPRFQQLGPLTQGILLERSNTCWTRHNRVFSIANGWQYSDITALSATRPSIFGTNTAYEIDEGVSVGVSHKIRRPITDAGGLDIADNSIICVSAIVEYVDMPYVAVGLRAKSGVFPSQRFKIDPNSPKVAGTFTGGEIQYAADIVYMGNNRYHIWSSYNVGSGATQPIMELLGADANDTTVVYDGANRSFIVHAFWIDDGVYPQVFYPVGADPITRTADVITFASENQPANDFVDAVEFYGRDASRLSGTSAERVLLQSGNLKFLITDNDFIVDIGGSRLTYSEPIYHDSHHKMALTKSSSGASLWVDGVEVDTDAGLTAAIVPGTIYVGSDSNGENHADCPIKKLTIDEWSP